jgi:uncharacterized protein YecE (DUF72 family)
VEQLRGWAKQIERRRRARHDVYATFSNDDAGHAVANARVIWSLLGGSAAVVARTSADAEAREPGGGRPRRTNGAVS